MSTINDEWSRYLQSQSQFSIGTHMAMNPICSSPAVCMSDDESEDCETIRNMCGELNISTKTKVLYLNMRDFDITELFWNLPVTEYWKPEECIVKKQMKIISDTPEQYNVLVERLKTVPYYTETIIKQINNPSARRVKFNDQRKITVGISKKDIMNCRGKVKKAFDNCFAVIIRFNYHGTFREIHVKIFATGKLEIPGILNAEILELVRNMILRLFRPYLSETLDFVDTDTEENVLINSNFNCGFYINREKLYAILRSEKYGIETSFDSCIYPGIKCKYYFNNELPFDIAVQRGTISREDHGVKMSELNDMNKYTEVSFMIFRTGSCLIVGNCTEKILQFIYQFIRNLLIDEYSNIHTITEESTVKPKTAKLRKKNVSISNAYYSELTSVTPIM